MDVGLTGDFSRDNARAVGMAVPTALSVTALGYAISRNPGVKKFTLRVNPFTLAMVEKMVETVPGEYHIAIVTDPKYPRDQWLLSPQGA